MTPTTMVPGSPLAMVDSGVGTGHSDDDEFEHLTEACRLHFSGATEGVEQFFVVATTCSITLWD